jgi:hypothetical protein
MEQLTGRPNRPTVLLSAEKWLLGRKMVSLGYQCESPFGSQLNVPFQ